MCSKNVFFPLGFWVGLPQNLGFDFSVWLAPRPLLLLPHLPLVAEQGAEDEGQQLAGGREQRHDEDEHAAHRRRGHLPDVDGGEGEVDAHAGAGQQPGRVQVARRRGEVRQQAPAEEGRRRDEQRVRPAEACEHRPAHLQHAEAVPFTDLDLLS